MLEVLGGVGVVGMREALGLMVVVATVGEGVGGGLARRGEPPRVRL